MRNKGPLPPCLPGFENVYRYYAAGSEITARLRPGDYYVTDAVERVETTLGSCIAACIRDPEIGIGGMNHFLLPDTTSDAVGARYGNFAMEALINEILKRGGLRSRLEIKIFGGARMLTSGTDIGQQNIEFVEEYLSMEHLAVQSRDLGGDRARLVRFWPTTGQVRMKRIGDGSDVVRAERELQRTAPKKPAGGSVELF